MVHKDPLIEKILDSCDSGRIAARSRFEEEDARRKGLFYRIGEFDFAQPRFLIEGFLPRGGLVILAGDPKVGKTAMASAIALAVAKGEPFAGMPVQQAGVLWLALEESFQERGAVMRMAKGFKDIPFYTNVEKIAIDTEEGIDDLDYWRMRTDAKLIVVDPLHGAHSGRSLGDGWAARKTLARLKTFCTQAGVTALVIHHLAKSRRWLRLAENAQIAAIATMVMILTRENDPTRRQSRIVALHCTGRGAFANRTLRFISPSPLEYVLARPLFAQFDENKTEALAARILDHLKNGTCSALDLAQALRSNVGSVRNAITALKAQAKLCPAKKCGKATIYELTKKCRSEKTA